jgi:hypothetical protein
MTARASIVAIALVATPLFVAACDCSGPATPSGHCAASAECRAGQVCIDSRCVAMPDTNGLDGGTTPVDTGVVPMDAWGRCTSSASCGAGYECAGGMCCASADVCGESCCGSGQTCFAGACVMPGVTCRTTADCASGEYCEPALGGSGSDGGVSDAGVSTTDAGRACTTPPPAPGRCLALPPTCPTLPDGGALDAGTTACTTMCEYHPAVGALDAVVAWSWGQPTPPPDFPGRIDVWSTPAVGRLYDANCDGTVDELDPPSVVVVTGSVANSAGGPGTCCQCTGNTPTECHRGVLRAIDGRTGETQWSLRDSGAGPAGFSATSVALGDIDGDGAMDIVAATNDRHVVLVDGSGHVTRTSDLPIPIPGSGTNDDGFGWGGGFAIADMDQDGHPEIAWGATVFHTTGGTITRAWTGTGGGAGGVSDSLSVFADVDGAADGNLELVAERTVYRADGTILWNNGTLPDGFPAVADMNADGMPDIVVVGNTTVTIVRGVDGHVIAGPFALMSGSSGGPPTIADFDGDGMPEIGVAQRNVYSMLQINAAGTGIEEVWNSPNHDRSSSETGSTVFDFEGDGIAEVIYADECFLWVFDGPTGHVRFAGLTSSFTGTEASIVADVDGDGHAEIVLVSNGVDMSAAGNWPCNAAPWNTDTTATDPAHGHPAWHPPTGATAWQGIRMFRDAARSWVGTRPIWNEHSYHVTNVCVPGDGACAAGEGYGAIPVHETPSWTLSWVNNYRQNVQQSGVFDAADATLSLEVRCTNPVELVASLHNVGAAILPPGVAVDFFRVDAGGTEVPLGSATSTGSVFPGAVTQLTLALPAGADPLATYRARIDNPTAMPTFRECREDNDTSPDATGHCLM